MKSTRGTAGRIFSALAHANVNVKMIDQGSSELNIIIGVANDDFETAIKAIYDIFVTFLRERAMSRLAATRSFDEFKTVAMECVSRF